jgi:hypothetical protein
MFQVKVWETAFGTSYEQALVAPPIGGRAALLGKSNIIRVDTEDPSDLTGTPTSLVVSGLQGFYVGNPEVCIPEPSPFSFITIGLVTTWILYETRHKRGPESRGKTRRCGLRYTALAGAIIAIFTFNQAWAATNHPMIQLPSRNLVTNGSTAYLSGPGELL